jgi:hypothetical protein
MKTKAIERAQAARRIFWAEAWEGWLRPVLAAGTALLLVVLYVADVLPERAFAALVVGSALGAMLFAGAWFTWRRAASPAARGAVAAFVALWLFAAAYPAVRALFPPAPAATVRLGHAGEETAHVPADFSRAELRITGHLKPLGEQTEVSAEYEFTVSDSGGASEDVAGRVRRSFVSVRARRATMRRKVEQDTELVPLHAARGPELRFAPRRMGENLDGLTVDVLPAPVPMTWIYALGAAVLLFGAALEARLSSATNRAPALVASAPSLAFAFAYRSQATPTHLVQPALGALFIAALAAVGATAIAALARKVVPRAKP